MARQRRKFARQKQERQESARMAQEMLISTLENKLVAEAEFSDKIAAQIWKIGQRHKVGVPNSHRHSICRKCKSLLLSSDSVRVRIRNGNIIATCLRCGAIRRKIGGVVDEKNTN